MIARVARQGDAAVCCPIAKVKADFQAQGFEQLADDFFGEFGEIYSAVGKVAE